MGLFGIFDPIVRSYFKDRSDGGESASGLAIVTYVPGENYEILEGTIVKISNLSPSVNDLEGGFMAVVDTASNLVVGEFSGLTLSVANGSIVENKDAGVVMVMVPGADTPSAFIFSQDADNIPLGWYVDTEIFSDTVTKVWFAYGAALTATEVPT